MRCKLFDSLRNLDRDINTWLSTLNDQEWEVSHVVAVTTSPYVLVFVRRKA